MMSLYNRTPCSSSSSSCQYVCKQTIGRANEDNGEGQTTDVLTSEINNIWSTLTGSQFIDRNGYNALEIDRYLFQM